MDVSWGRLLQDAEGLAAGTAGGTVLPQNIVQIERNAVSLMQPSAGVRAYVEHVAKFQTSLQTVARAKHNLADFRTRLIYSAVHPSKATACWPAQVSISLRLIATSRGFRIMRAPMSHRMCWCAASMT